ncbi:putative magnesium transporter NIPA4 [Citrus sinensis]|nr:putative magnesium transporter NIPA4 [Citrus sinensis]
MDESSVGSWRDSYRGMSSDNVKGLVLALSSSFFIGASFIVKKKGLKKAGSSGVRAGVGGYSYLYEPLWWVGMIATFLLYAALVLVAVFVLVVQFIPEYGQTHVMVYIGVCSLVGSLSVMSVKALGIALKLTFEGMNQLIYPQTWIFTMIVLVCVITQMNYLNKALDTFNTAVVSPIYYVMFTSLTILASVIMFKDWDRQNPTQIVTEICGFVTILSGTFLLHKTKDAVDGSSASIQMRMSKHSDENAYDPEGMPLRRQDNMRPS